MNKRVTTQLREQILDKELLIMPGAFDPVSARIIEAAGFKSIQCSGAAIAGSHLGLPDLSMLGMQDMLDRTRRICESVSIPVMADGDTGFGNAVNVHYAVHGFERAGAAGVNLEDQIMPKRCGHLDGKQVIPLEEAAIKIRAAYEALDDKDFVINARTDTLATDGIEEVIRRGNAYLEAGATMIFVEGVTSESVIEAAVAGIDGPVAMNLVEGGKSPQGLTFTRLQELGVARVSLPGSLIFAAIKGMQTVLQDIIKNDGIEGYESKVTVLRDAFSIFGMDEALAIEKRYLSAPKAASVQQKVA